jgi:predicted AAA+ superfamily ATPase
VDKSLYRKRVVDEIIEQYLQVFGAVCIEGPKWCGKTWTAERHSNSVFYVGDPEGNFQNRELAKLNPTLVLKGEQPRTIDEWQEVPSLWDAVRFYVDQSSKKGQFILTGSATPPQKGVLHSGTGRIATLRMMPMSLYESGDSSAIVSLKSLCNEIMESQLLEEVSLKNIAHLILRGGWPASIGLSTKNAVLVPQMYLDNVIKEDVDKIDLRTRNKSKMWLLLRSLARAESTTMGKRKLKEDMATVEKDTIDEETIDEYLQLFSQLFILENQKPFSTSLRSSLRIKQAEKRHFTDPSFACSLLGITNEEQLIGDLQTFGFLFESLCIRDLKIYAQGFGGKVFHYQDYQNDEIDAVIELPDGSWCAFEIKLGAHQIDEAANKLIRINKKFNKPAKVLCVISALSNAAYKREDGVFVIPITSLAP